MPRLPEHCIEYARLLAWTDDTPFGDIPVDGDDTDHIMWIMDRAKVNLGSRHLSKNNIDKSRRIWNFD